MVSLENHPLIHIMSVYYVHSLNQEFYLWESLLRSESGIKKDLVQRCSSRYHVK